MIVKILEIINIMYITFNNTKYDNTLTYNKETHIYCWFILIGSFCLDKNASILRNFLYRDFHNRDIIFLEFSRIVFIEDLFQYEKG
jgi:hypothetical protein